MIRNKATEVVELFGKDPRLFGVLSFLEVKKCALILVTSQIDEFGNYDILTIKQKERLKYFIDLKFQIEQL